MKPYYIIIPVIILYLIWTIIELKNLHKFNIGYFDRGFRIFRKEIKHRFSNWKYLDGIYEEPEGKYAFLPDLKIGFFVTKFEFYRRRNLFYQSRGFPLTIFGKIEEIDNKIELSYFISHRLFGLISLIYLGWISLPIIMRNWEVILFSLVGILITSLILYIVYRFKKWKMLLISDEIIKILKVKQ